jgi:hypothetical protein
MRIAYAVVVLPLLSLAVPLACAGGRQTLGFLPPDAGTAAPIDGGGPTLFTDAALGDGGQCSTQCSDDLHQIVTCTNPPQVVQTCTGDTACGGSSCIPACQAAAANKSTVGCDYYAVPPDVWNYAAWNTSQSAPGNCFAAFVTNNWSVDGGTPMQVSLVWKGQTINAMPFAYTAQAVDAGVDAGSAVTYTPVGDAGIPPNSMAIVFLNQTQDNPGSQSIPVPGDKTLCPAGVHAAVETEDVVLHGTNIGNAMEIQTSVPAVVYDIYPYGGAASGIPSATLLLPTNVWDTNYVAATMAETPANLPPGIDLVAQQDGTTVTVLPTTDITAGGRVTGTTKGTPVTYNINKGQTVHIMQFVDNSGNDLSGSIVNSNYPVGLWGEHFCLTQTAPPTWRILGMVDGTTLTYDPPNPSAPQTLAKGQLVEFDGPTVLHVQSQDAGYPFYLATHRPGDGDCDSGHQQIPPVQSLGSEYVAVANDPNESITYNLGGPETVNVIPPSQFLKSYRLFTDPTYRYTEHALVRVKAADKTFKDVNLDCLGIVTGWQPVGSSGQYEYTRVPLREADSQVGNCDNGLHTITSDQGFGVTVWGFDGAASYAYPAGASVKPINNVVVQ